jgi:hypothetical protein
MERRKPLPPVSLKWSPDTPWPDPAA